MLQYTSLDYRIFGYRHITHVSRCGLLVSATNRAVFLFMYMQM